MVEMPTRIAPRSRRCRVRARVSTPLMPTMFWKDAMFVISQKILAGEMTGAQSAAKAHEITEKWKSQNPDMLEHYRAWAGELGERLDA